RREQSCFSGDGRVVGVATAAGAQAWEVESGRNLELPPGFDDLALSADGTQAALTGKSGVMVWDLQSRAPRLRLAQSGATQPRLSQDGTRLVALSASPLGQSIVYV